jgi:hypothetical protein
MKALGVRRIEIGHALAPIGPGPTPDLATGHEHVLATPHGEAFIFMGSWIRRYVE